MAPRETENNAYAKFWVHNKEHYGMLRYFLEWSITIMAFWRRNMSRSRESRPRGSRKQQTKITYPARARTLNRLKKIIMGHRDSLS